VRKWDVAQLTLFESGDRIVADDLFVMDYATQLHYTHAVPKTREPVGERISLAFRVKPDRAAPDKRSNAGAS
jgi:hypothetical protein